MAKAREENPAARGKLARLFKPHENGRAQIWEIWVERDGEHGVMVTRFGIDGGKLQVNKEKITKGKNEGKKNETSPLQQACAEAAARWRKQRDRKGYAETLGAAVGKKTLRPMLAETYENHSGKIDWTTAVAQPKFDGFRANFRRDKGKVVCFSRDGKPLKLPHLEAMLNNVLGDSEILDGELYRHGLSLNKISSACKKEGELTPTIGLRVYDMFTGGPYLLRYEAIKAIVKQVTAPADKEAGKIELVESVKVRSPEELTIFQAECIDLGYEGAMLRHGRAGYESGHRSDSLLKVKTFVDGEFEIIDWKPARGKYEGAPVFVCQTEEGHTFDCLVHGTVAEKKAHAENADKRIGSMLKIKFAGMTKTAEPVPFQPVAKMFMD